MPCAAADLRRRLNWYQDNSNDNADEERKDGENGNIKDRFFQTRIVMYENVLPMGGGH
jgi:hypothetical protein